MADFRHVCNCDGGGQVEGQKLRNTIFCTTTDYRIFTKGLFETLHLWVYCCFPTKSQTDPGLEIEKCLVAPEELMFKIVVHKDSD